MTVYTKVCVICQRKFYAVKVNKIYCSKQCSNRTRYLPKELVAQLVERNNKFAIKANKYAAMISNPDGSETTVGYEPKEITVAHPLGKDEGLLLALAKLEIQQRQDQVLRDKQDKERSLESESGFGMIGSSPVDTEMVEMKLPEVSQEQPTKRKFGGGLKK